MVPNKANDGTVIRIQEIFDNISKFNYEEAFYLSCEIMERNENGDQLFHEWVKALTEFFSCKKKNDAIELLEKIKPNVLENEIHFRIINSLIDFYRVVGDEENFLKHKNIIYPQLNKLENPELKYKILYNIANGFYSFEDYEKALKYSEKSISIARRINVFNTDFSLSMIVKIMSLFYLGRNKEAKYFKEIFLNFLEVTDSICHKKYLEIELKEFHEKEGCKSEESI